MFFSVILPTYNRANVLKKALKRIYNQSVEEIDFELIIVNDGSTDNTDDVVEEFRKEHDNIIYLKQKNQGQGVARNKAIKKAKGKVILFIQDDIFATRDLFYEHQKFHYLHEAENVAVLGFTAWHPQLKITKYMSWLTNGSAVLGRFGGQQFAYEKLKGKSLADYNFFYTSNLSIKASILKKNLFDTEFGGYGWEDIELGFRLETKENLKILYNSWAVAYHYHPMSLDDLQKRMKSVGYFAYVFDQKHPQLHKVPKGLKRAILRLLSSGVVISILFYVYKLSGEKFHSLYYYCLSKKYFFEGLKIAENGGELG